MKYILKNKQPVICNDTPAWAEFMESDDIIVAQSHVGGVYVSTVFLGLDYNFNVMSESEPILNEPILFETMVFRGRLDGVRMRYCTWEQAKAGHEKIVKRIRKEQK